MFDDSNGDYSLRFFSPNCSPATKKRGLIFTVFFCLIILAQCCYWIFGNSALPIVLGMPFGMFIVVSLIAVEFAGLLVLYRLDSCNDHQEVR